VTLLNKLHALMIEETSVEWVLNGHELYNLLVII